MSLSSNPLYSFIMSLMKTQFGILCDLWCYATSILFLLVTPQHVTHGYSIPTSCHLQKLKIQLWIWFDRLFALIYEDPLILKLINGYKISQTTIIIVKFRDIWGRDKLPLVWVVDYDHTKDDHHAMWNRCLHIRQALGEVYNMQALYNTYSPLSPNTITTPDSSLLCTVHPPGSIKAVRAICLLSEYLGEIL